MEKVTPISWLSDKVKGGSKVVFDFKTLSVKVNEEYIFKDGKLVSHQDEILMCEKWEFNITYEALQKELDIYYQLYKHSIPSANEPSRTYFKALKYDELSEDDKMVGISRAVARFELESILFCLAMAGRTKELFTNGYFWRSKQDPDFVIMKSWFNL